jgi:hypothetical protein
LSISLSVTNLFIGWLSQNLLEGTGLGSMQRRKSMERVGFGRKFSYVAAATLDI